MEDDEDVTIKEINVYLSKQLDKQLYLFQYPVRPKEMPYDDVEHLSTRFKPHKKIAELQLGIDTKSPNYCKSKGEQIALNVDGAISGQDSSYLNGCMDKQTLSSNPLGIATDKYACGILKHDGLHLTALDGIIQLRPSFTYLDKADGKSKARADAEENVTEEPEVKAVTVKFARRETEEAKAKREASYEFVMKQRNEEEWAYLKYVSENDRLAESARLDLISQKTHDITSLNISCSDYLKHLIPNSNLPCDEHSVDSNKVMSSNDLRTMTVGDQIKSLLISAKLIQFNQLVSLLPKSSDFLLILKHLQQVAMLVQGCWVVKSDILYPKDSCSPHSGVPAENLCRGRDYIMWRFTQVRHVIRKEVSVVVKLPAEDVKDILEQMAKLKVRAGWEFRLPHDTEFLEKYPDVKMRQDMLWDSKSKQLSKFLKFPSDVNDKSKRRRNSSKSRHLSGHSSDATSDKECSSDVIKESSKTEKQLSLNGFVKDSLLSRGVLTLQKLRNLLTLKLTESPAGHVLAMGVTDKMIEQAALNCEVKVIAIQEVSYFVVNKRGTELDAARELLASLVEHRKKFQFATFRKLIDENLSEMKIDDKKLKDLVEEICIKKPGNYWTLNTS